MAVLLVPEPSPLDSRDWDLSVTWVRAPPSAIRRASTASLCFFELRCDWYIESELSFLSGQKLQYCQVVDIRILGREFVTPHEEECGSSG